MYQVQSNKKRKRGRPPKEPSESVRTCPCGGASGNLECKLAIICNKCGKCKRGCKHYPHFYVVRVPNINQQKHPTRLHMGKITHVEGSLDVNKMFDVSSTPPAIKALEKTVDRQTVHHRVLSSPKVTISDLAVAFGKKQFYMARSDCTLFTLRDISPSN